VQDKRVGKAIQQAAEEVADLKLIDHFPLVVFVKILADESVLPYISYICD